MMYPNFSNYSLSQMSEYFNSLSGESSQIALGWLGQNGITVVGGQLTAGGEELNNSDLPILQEIGVRVEIWNRFGLTVPEFMAEKFGSDWEDLIRNPRASKMNGAGVDKVIGEINKRIKQGNKLPEDFEQLEFSAQMALLSKMQHCVVNSRSLDCGSPVLSILPIERGKHPCQKMVVKEVEVVRNGKKFMEEREVEVLAHTPGVGNLECESLVTNLHLAPVVRTVSSSSADCGAFGDITGGGKSRKIFIVGFVEVEKYHRCGGTGAILMEDGSISDPSEELEVLHHFLTSVGLQGGSSEDESLIYSTWLENCSLARYYRAKGLDGKKEAMRALSGGVTRSAWIPRVRSVGVDENQVYVIGAVFDRKLDPEDIRKRTLRAEVLAQEAIDRKILELSGLVSSKVRWLDAQLAKVDPAEVEKSDRLAGKNADPNRFQLPKIPDHIRLEFEQDARAALRRSAAAARIMKPAKQGRLRSKQSKMRTGDKSCTVNGARMVDLPNGIVQMQLRVRHEDGTTEVIWDGDSRYKGGVVGRSDLLKVLEWFEQATAGNFVMNWEVYGRAMAEIWAFKPGIGKAMLSTKQNREQLAEVMIQRMIGFSLEDGLAGLGTWVELDGRYFAGSEACQVWFRAAESDSERIADLLEAAQRAVAAGFEPGETEKSRDDFVRAVLASYRQKELWLRMVQEHQGSIMKDAMRATV